VTAVRTTLALALAALTACSGASSGAPEDQGGVSLAVSVHASLATSAAIPVAAVWVHLHGTSARGTALDVWSPASLSAGRYTLSFAKVPVGSYLVGGRAYSSATAAPTAVPDYESVAEVPVTVAMKTTSSVALTLQQNLVLHPPASTSDRAPTVDSLVASAQLVDSADPASVVTLSATASDPDGPADLAGFSWTATYVPTLAAGVAPGTFSAPAALATVFAPPRSYEGTVTVVFAATDLAGARAALSIALHVSPRNGSGNVGFTVDVNNHPDLGPVLAADAQPRPGAAVPLSVVAGDPDGDPLTFAWDDGGCGGTFAPQGASTTTWTAPGVVTACTLRVSVSDGRGGTNRSTLVVNVSTGGAVFGPEFVFATQSPGNPAPAAGPIWFRVEAVEPTSDPAAPRPVTALAWASAAGGLFEPVVAGDLSWVRWTPAVTCAGPGTVPVSVSVTATGTTQGPLGTPYRAAFDFAVDLTCP
jgi:hypothetical protein